MRRLASALAVGSALCAGALAAAPPAATPAPVPASSALGPEAVPAKEPLAPAENPAEAARKELIRDVYHRATTLAQAGDMAGAQKVLAEFAVSAGTADPYYDELQGTLLAIAKDYTGAQAAFERLLAKTPNSRVGRFNHAEMVMLQSRFGEAEKEFMAVEEKASPGDPAIADLCRFKRVMCLISSGKLAAADLLIPPLQENSESPALCFARAALEYAKNHGNKAVQLLEDARTRFPSGVENLYTDSLVELRWGQRDETGKFFFKPRLR